MYTSPPPLRAVLPGRLPIPRGGSNRAVGVTVLPQPSPLGLGFRVEKGSRVGDWTRRRKTGEDGEGRGERGGCGRISCPFCLANSCCVVVQRVDGPEMAEWLMDGLID